MRRRFFFVINPRAGTHSKTDLEFFLRQRADKSAFSYHIFHTAPSTHCYALQHELEAFDATDVIACGGDGTVNLVAAAVKHTHRNLGIIPAGSGNGLARAAGIPMRLTAAFDVVAAGNVSCIDGFTVNRHFACMLSGLGLDASVAGAFDQGGRRGLAGYVRHTLQQFIKCRPYRFEVFVDDCSFSTEAFFISVANANQFGNNMTIAPAARLSDGLLDLVVVQKMPKTLVPLRLLAQMNRCHRPATPSFSPGKGILYVQGRDIRISNPEHAPLHIDGDPAPNVADLHFAVLPRAIRLLTP